MNKCRPTLVSRPHLDAHHQRGVQRERPHNMHGMLQLSPKRRRGCPAAETISLQWQGAVVLQRRQSE